MGNVERPGSTVISASFSIGITIFLCGVSARTEWEGISEGEEGGSRSSSFATQ